MSSSSCLAPCLPLAQLLGCAKVGDAAKPMGPALMVCPRRAATNSCPHGEACPKFQSLKAGGVQYEDYLHCVDFWHDRTLCRHGLSCKARQRLMKGIYGSGAKRFEDACHLLVHGHGTLIGFSAGYGSELCVDDPCPIFLQMKENYDFSPANYQHCVRYKHPRFNCRYRTQCYAHQRLVSGGHAYKDVCHHAVYFHGRVLDLGETQDVVMLRSDNAEKVGSRWVGQDVRYGFFCPTIPVFDSGVASFGSPDDQLQRLLLEIVRNGFRKELTTKEGGNLVDVARAKLNDPRCLEIMARNRIPVTPAMILALIIYTGTEAQSDIRKWLRSTDTFFANRWRWQVTVDVIMGAVYALHEDPPHEVGYHGLNGVLPHSVLAEGGEDFRYRNLISTSMSLPVAQDFAVGVAGTVESKDRKCTGTVFHFLLHDIVPQGCCADMRWISKFPSEEEWLLVPFVQCHGVKWRVSSLPPSDGFPHLANVLVRPSGSVPKGKLLGPPPEDWKPEYSTAVKGLGFLLGYVLTIP